MSIVCPRCLSGTATFIHIPKQGTFISCPHCGTYSVIVADLETLREVWYAFQKIRKEDLTLGTFMHRLEIALGFRNVHGDVTEFGYKILML